MSASHFDVLIDGTGLSGIGTACPVSTEMSNKSVGLMERRECRGPARPLVRDPGECSDLDRHGLGAGFRPLQNTKVADIASRYGCRRLKPPWTSAP